MREYTPSSLHKYDTKSGPELVASAQTDCLKT